MIYLIPFALLALALVGLYWLMSPPPYRWHTHSFHQRRAPWYWRLWRTAKRNKPSLQMRLRKRTWQREQYGAKQWEM